MPEDWTRGFQKINGEQDQKNTEEQKSEPNPIKRWFGVVENNQASNATQHKHSSDLSASSLSPAEIEAHLRATKGDDYVEKLKKGELYGGACPTDPFERVMCESCQ
jgi:hypothetical protein